MMDESNNNKNRKLAKHEHEITVKTTALPNNSYEFGDKKSQ